MIIPNSELIIVKITQIMKNQKIQYYMDDMSITNGINKTNRKSLKSSSTLLKLNYMVVKET